jgi:LuxR family maltose regulon positive regulatory protein
VERERLLRPLVGTEAVCMVLVRAPAGYGKTTLLDSWARRDPRPFHWLRPGRGPRSRTRCSEELAAIAAAPRRLAPPWVLVLDGLSADAGAGALDDVAWIADAVPPGCLLVVASRGAPVVPVARLRAQHDVLELGPRDLAMTHGEARALLEASGIRIGGPALDAVMATSEGWPAVLSLAAQSLGVDVDLQEAQAFGRDDPFVGDYVRDEVLPGVRPATARFLRRSAVLDVLEAEACDVVLDESGSAAQLFELERSDLPVSRVGRTGQRLRCHPLLRGVLREELRCREPSTEAELHRRASAWFESRDDLDAAIGHALAGRDLDRAAALLWRVAQSAAWDGRQALLDRWLRALPGAAVERHEALGLAAAMGDLARLRLAEVDHRLTCLEGTRDRAPAPAPSLRAGRAALEAATTRTGVAPMRERAALVARLAPDEAPLRALCCLLEGAGAMLAGEADTAAAALEDGARRGVIAAPALAALCAAELALIALVAEDWEHGATLAERARSRAEAVGVEEHAVLALVVAVAAFARAHRGRFAEARLDVELAKRLLADREDVPPWYSAQVSLALARAELRLSDRAAAHALLAQAQRAARRLPDGPALAAWIAGAGAGADAPTALPAAEALTVAELRVLRFLPSHLSFREIGGCLHVSANTIKSQAQAVYRKLGASSRSVAVDRARALGLLDAATTRSPGSEDAPGFGRA